MRFDPVAMVSDGPGRHLTVVLLTGLLVGLAVLAVLSEVEVLRWAGVTVLFLIGMATFRLATWSTTRIRRLEERASTLESLVRASAIDGAERSSGLLARIEQVEATFRSAEAEYSAGRDAQLDVLRLLFRRDTELAVTLTRVLADPSDIQ